MSTGLPYTFPTDEELRGRRVLVMGLGLFGGGAAVVRFLVSRGAAVRVVDLREEGALTESLATLEGVPFERCFGRPHRESDFVDQELVVVNPAVAPTSPHLSFAVRRGIPLTSEVGLTLSRLRAETVLVTGSKGKTTTATLLHRMLVAGGRDAVLGGNVGTSLLDRVDELLPEQVAVFEISSFQLDQVQDLTRRPAGLAASVSLITNLFPVHLDRHGTFEAYRALKWSVVAGARRVVLDFEDPELRRLGEPLGDAVTWFSAGAPPPRGFHREGERAIDVGDAARQVDLAELRIPGAHNVDNAMAAFAAATLLGVDPAACGRAIRCFEGVPHRLERLPNRDEIQYVNDSIATTPRATRAALCALDGPIILLLGGFAEGGVELGDLWPALADRVRCVIPFGGAGPGITAAASAGGRPDVVEPAASDLAGAFAAARRLARPGDTVLLSPGFPSFDEFRNFRERGEAFRRLARGGSEGLYHR